MLSYSIGDIHGRLDLLKELFDKIYEDASKYDETHLIELVFLGDYIDRGPDSKGVIDFIIGLQNHESLFKSIVTLRGNHEDFMIQALRGNHHAESSWIYNGGVQCLASYGFVGPSAGQTNWRHCIPKEHEEFLMNTYLSYQSDHVVYVHAGIHPDLPLENQSDDILIWSREWNDFNDEYPHGYFVVHGHTPLRGDQPDVRTAQINIDTGAVFGGKLTCCVIDTEAEFGNHRFIQV